jgi:DMSO/TMAO reductase YedYZ molybdopterin-dependent catalytic subunit
MEIRERLPEQEVAAEVAGKPARLKVDGLVSYPLELDPEALATLPRSSLTEAFRCEEGWEVPGLTWEGVPLVEVIAPARPASEARFVRVGAGGYVVPIPLEQAFRALLCDRLNGAPLTLRHGAPWRLVLPGGACFTSVKWVDRLTLTAEAGENDGERIARARRRRA